MAGSLSAPGKVLTLLCLMYFITYIDRVNIATAAPYIKTEFGLTNTQLGFVFSVFYYPYALFQIGGGLMGDRLGARLTLFLCGFIWATATIATGFVGGLISLIMARIVVGLGEGATFPVATRAMQNWISPQKRGFAQGITHSSSRGANAITPILVVFLIEATSWRGSFIIIGCVSALWVAIWYWYFRDDPSSHKGITEDDLRRLPPYAEDRATTRRPIPWTRLTLRMLPVSLTYFCYAWTLWLLLNWLPSFFKEGYHLDLKNSAFFSFGVFAAGVIGDTAGGVATDAIWQATGNLKLARLSVINVGMLGAAGCLLGVVLGPTDVNTIAILLSAGFFFLELVIGPIWSVPMDIAPQHSGTASGMMNTGSAVAGIISPLAFGAIVDWTGNWVLPFAVSIGLLILGIVLSFTMHPERKFLDVEDATYTPTPVAAE